MIQKIYNELLVVVVVFLSLWALFSWIKFPSPNIDLTIPVRTEEEIGDVIIEAYLKSNTVIKDSLILKVVDEISERLIQNLDNSEYYHKFYVVNNPEVNAFASLGGNIVIFSGLLKLADSPEEVAAVLAHEIGHVEEKHVSKTLVSKLGVAMLSSILTGGDPTLVLEILEMTLSNTFSRSQEDKADDFSLELLEKSGIPPSSLATFFKKMKKINDFGYEKQLEFFSTHPETDKRIRKSMRYKTKDNFQHVPFNINWSEIKEVLK
jgi:beta-barrel assembly-enhancing protease